LTTIEAAKIRRSRRTYNRQPLGDDRRDSIQTLVATINAESGLSIQAVFDRPEWFGGFLKTYGLLSGVQHFLVMAGLSNQAHLEETVGYYGERLVLELTKLDLGTCWVGGSFDHSKVGALLKPSEQLIAVIAFGCVDASPSIKESMVRGALFRKKPDLRRFVETDGTEADWFHEGVRLASIAPSAVHLQPFRFHCQNGVVSIRQTANTPFATVDLGIAKYHFELAVPNRCFERGDFAELKIPSTTP
jgi:nitroreductase